MSTLTTIHNSSASIINTNTASIHTDLNTSFSGQVTAVQEQLQIWKLEATGPVEEPNCAFFFAHAQELVS
jgi:hypothetical protein